MASNLLDAALGAAERVLLDSSTLIAFHSPQEQTHHVATHLLRRIEANDDPLHGYYSVISATELLIRPLRTSMQDFTYMHVFLSSFPHLTILPADLHVAVQAASIRASTNMRLADAMIVASGLLAGCEAIISNDEKWKRQLSALFPTLEWLYLGDYK